MYEEMNFKINICICSVFWRGAKFAVVLHVDKPEPNASKYFIEHHGKTPESLPV